MAQRTADVSWYVLDTSALLAYIEDEEGAEKVESLLAQAEEERAILLVSFITYTEIFYITLRERGEETAAEHIDLLDQLPLIRLESDPPTSIIAGRFKAQYSISLGDCWIAALAEMYEAQLIHKDPEFEAVSDQIELIPLPYKQSGA